MEASVIRIVLVATLLFCAHVYANEPANIRLEFRKQTREGNHWKTLVAKEDVLVAKTAIVVVDMWDKHHCRTAMSEQAKLIEPMNKMLAAARNVGIQVVFAPAEVVEFYRSYPQRKAMLAIPKHRIPDRPALDMPEAPHSGWSYCMCSEDRPCKKHYADWLKHKQQRQHPDLVIADQDLIANCDTTNEVYNLCAERSITTLLYCGIHTNMCVIGRKAGMRALTRAGVRCAIIRDMTEAFHGLPYDPELTPQQVTAEVVEYIERYIGPSIGSSQISKAVEERAKQ